jgi:hypothetical protein
MARTCVLSVDDSTPEAGQQVTVTATFSNDSTEVSITGLVPLSPQAFAGFSGAEEALVGQTLAPDDGSPVETVLTFPVVAAIGQPNSIALTIDFQAILSDGTSIDATGVAITVSPVTLPGDSFPWS